MKFHLRLLVYELSNYGNLLFYSVKYIYVLFKIYLLKLYKNGICEKRVNTFYSYLFARCKAHLLYVHVYALNKYIRFDAYNVEVTFIL